MYGKIIRKLVHLTSRLPIIVGAITRRQTVALSLAVLVATGAVESAAQQAPLRSGVYEFFPEGQAGAAGARYVILVSGSEEIFVRGGDQHWTGRGKFSAKDGYYDWVFSDGRTGRTTFAINTDGTLNGMVLGSGINWRFVARRDPSSVVNNDSVQQIEQQRQTDLSRARALAQPNEYAQRMALAKQAIRDRFVAEHGVQKFVQPNELVANPFLFKDRVVATALPFVRMLSESEAQFGSGEFVVAGVPATEFRGNEQAVLAIKVRGTRVIKVGSAEAIVPDLRFVGAYICQQNGCADFFD